MKAKILRAANSAFSTVGLTVLPEWRLKEEGFVRLLKRVFKDHRIQHVIDVGANEGQYGSWLRERLGYRGPITSFEPLDSAFAQLKSRALSDGKWLAVQCAAGECEYDATINVTSDTTFSSMHKPSTEVTKHYRELNSIVLLQKVSVKRLDNLSLPTNFYLKIDTQGHDLQVLEGAVGVLDRIPACQIEIPNMKIYDDIPSMTECLEYMDRIGFELIGLFPVSQIKWARVVDFDGVFVNRAYCT